MPDIKKVWQELKEEAFLSLSEIVFFAPLNKDSRTATIV